MSLTIPDVVKAPVTLAPLPLNSPLPTAQEAVPMIQVILVAAEVPDIPVTLAASLTTTETQVTWGVWGVAQEVTTRAPASPLAEAMKHGKCWLRNIAIGNSDKRIQNLVL